MRNKALYVSRVHMLVFIVSVLFSSMLCAQTREEAIPTMDPKVHDAVAPVTVRIVCGESKKIGGGSIVAVTESGQAVILTACHVVLKNYQAGNITIVPDFEKLQVKLAGESMTRRAISSAQLIDLANDVALITTESAVLDDRVISYTHSDGVRPGQKVAAFGFPVSDELSQTVGRITRQETNYLVFDANIAPGSSGGPLVDEHGRMIGMSTYVEGNEGNALKVDIIEPIVNTWLEPLKLKKKWDYAKYATVWEHMRKDPVYLGAEGAVFGAIIWVIAGGKSETQSPAAFGWPPGGPP